MMAEESQRTKRCLSFGDYVKQVKPSAIDVEIREDGLMETTVYCECKEQDVGLSPDKSLTARKAFGFVCFNYVFIIRVAIHYGSSLVHRMLCLDNYF